MTKYKLKVIPVTPVEKIKVTTVLIEVRMR